MRVTFITHYATLYGANRSLLNLIDGLRAHGVESSVVCCSTGAITEELSKREIPYCVFPIRWWLNPATPFQRLGGLKRFLQNVCRIPALKKLVLPWQPDIIYSNSSATPMGALLAESLGKPHVWHIREFGTLDYNLKYDLGDAFYKYWLNRAARVIAISHVIKDEVLKGVHATIHIIYNGVISTDELENLARGDSTETDQSSGFSFVIAGLINPAKGQLDAINALAIVHRTHPQVELLIAGTGYDGDIQKVRELSEELEVAANVHLLGFVDNIFSVFGRSDAVLMCSRFEGFGRVTAEAMAAGKPVIGYNSAGTAEIIDHGINGLLYDGGAENLAACMNRLIEDRQLALELGKNGREKAKKEFTVEAYAEKVYAVLNSVVTNGETET